MPRRTVVFAVIVAFIAGFALARLLPTHARSGSYADVTGQWCADNGGEYTPASEAFGLPSVCVIP